MITILIISIVILVGLLIWVFRLYRGERKQRKQWIKLYLAEKLKNERYGI